MHAKLIPADDLVYITENLVGYRDNLKNVEIFVTGGTGFFGIWLVVSFLALNKAYDLNARMTVLSRHPEDFYKKFPQLKDELSLSLVQGDVCNFVHDDHSYTHIIHAATAASDQLNREYPLLMEKTIVEGTQHVLELAKSCKNLESLLFTSSGAIYGNQPFELDKIPESYLGAPDPLGTNAYANAKRFAEQLSVLYAQEYGFSVKIARCFAFVGPYLPLNTHFAIGNFISNVLHGQDILIKGDGKPLRSYLYAADLARSLWTLLLKGSAGQAYNVGSDQAISVADLARLVANFSQRPIKVIVEGDSKLVGNSSRYIPDTHKISQLGVSKIISLEQSIEKTLKWYEQ